MFDLKDDVFKEGLKIKNILENEYPEYLDGKECIIEMKRNGSKNWRQMEWAGWYFEEKSFNILVEKIGGSKGTKFGNTVFDYKKRYIWDFKFHALKGGDEWCIMNDSEAIFNAIKENGSLGFCVCQGIVTYDDINQSFKKWHDKIKGKTSNYEIERIRRGASSRRRKIGFKISNFLTYAFCNTEEIENGVNKGWIKGFQKNFRNADGSPRRSKLQISLKRIPNDLIIKKK